MAEKEVNPTVHPRVIARVWLERAARAWEREDLARYGHCVNYALAWYMLASGEGWSRIVEDCGLSDATARQFKRIERMRLPMERHTPDHLRKVI